MFDGFTLHQAIDEALCNTEECIDEMHSLGIDKAQARKDYRIAYSKEILAMRNAGMPATIIADVVKGFPHIAELRFKLECAEAHYDGNFQAILYWKKRVDTLREELDREWSKAGER